MHKGRQERVGIAVEPVAKKLWNCQNNMAITDARKHAATNEISPTVGINLGARQTEGGFATECKEECFAAGGAAVLREPHFVGIPAIEHLPHHFVMIRSIVMRAGGLKRLPVVPKDLLECVLVDMFHSRIS